MSAGRILVVDDEADIRGLVKEILSDEGYEVEVAANAAEARRLRASAAPDLVLLDIWMPEVDGITLLREWAAAGDDSCPVVMMSGHGTVETAVEATRLGAIDFVEKPLSIAKLLRMVERGLEAGRQKKSSRRKLLAPAALPIGKSRTLQQLRRQLDQYATSDAPVLLLGEPGAGREAFARYLHEQGPRAAQPFVTVVASALRDRDFELALFGSAGSQEPGLLEQAANGILFINELTDLPWDAQRVLLGVLESGSYSRLGESTKKPFSARLVASAEPKVLRRVSSVEAPAQGGVRRDLLDRLGGLLAEVPALRDYAEDIPELLRFHVDQLVDAEGLSFRRFGVAAQNRLRNYPWPGNVQELRGLVHRLLLQGGSEEISLEEIEKELSRETSQAETLVKQDLLALSLREAREHFERSYLQQQLQLCHGKVGQLAKRVGMERTHLYRKLRALGIDFRGGVEDDT